MAELDPNPELSGCRVWMLTTCLCPVTWKGRNTWELGPGGEQGRRHLGQVASSLSGAGKEEEELAGATGIAKAGTGQV